MFSCAFLQVLHFYTVVMIEMTALSFNTMFVSLLAIGKTGFCDERNNM